MRADIEAARDAIKVQLQSKEFADILIAIYEEKLEEAPQEIFNEIYTVLKWAPQNFPNCQMGPARGLNREEESLGWLDIEYEFSLYVMNTHTDEEHLQRTLERLVRAMQDFYKAKPSLLVEQSSCPIWTGDEDYSPLINQGDGRPFIQAASLTIFIRMQR
jgi:hypothetical protein